MGNKNAHSSALRLVTLPLKVALGLVLAAVAVVGLTNLVTIGTTRGDVHTIADVADYNADAIVVLGASVHADGTPSDMLRHRLDTTPPCPYSFKPNTSSLGRFIPVR